MSSRRYSWTRAPWFSSHRELKNGAEVLVLPPSLEVASRREAKTEQELLFLCSKQIFAWLCKKWCTHNLLWVQSVRTELGLSACNQSAFWRQWVKAPAFLSPTLPPCVVFDLSLGCISEWGLKMAASWKWVGIWAGIHERNSAFQTIQGRSVFTTLDWAVSPFRVAECWLPIVSSIWNKLHPLHQSRTVIGPRGWSEAPQASYFWLWISRSLKSVWDEDLFGLEFLMYFQVQNFVHNLTVENYMDSWVGYLCVCSTVALPTNLVGKRQSKLR